MYDVHLVFIVQDWNWWWRWFLSSRSSFGIFFLHVLMLFRIHFLGWKQEIWHNFTTQLLVNWIWLHLICLLQLFLWFFRSMMSSREIFVCFGILKNPERWGLLFNFFFCVSVSGWLLFLAMRVVFNCFSLNCFWTPVNIFMLNVERKWFGFEGKRVIGP